MKIGDILAANKPKTYWVRGVADSNDIPVWDFGEQFLQGNDKFPNQDFEIKEIGVIQGGGNDARLYGIASKSGMVYWQLILKTGDYHLIKKYD